MSSLYENNKKEKQISYKQQLFIKTSLRQLGISPNHNGFIAFQKAIRYAYKKDMIAINLEEIYKNVAKSSSQSHKTIESSIRYSFYNISTKKLSINYEKIFGVEFSLEFFSIRSLISDFIDVLETMES